ncbi:MAG: DNA-binding protein [Gammaproteobacteria bacterium]
MKIEKNRLNLIVEFESAPDSALFTQEMIAAIRDCSLATIERDRWAGTGVPFIKIGRLVRYRKADIQNWLNQYLSLQSTSQYSQPMGGIYVNG